MAQPDSNKRTTLGSGLFFKKPNGDAPFKRKQWQTHLKLALSAEENIKLDTLLVGPQPENVQLPRDPLYEDTKTLFKGTLQHNQNGKD